MTGLHGAPMDLDEIRARSAVERGLMWEAFRVRLNVPPMALPSTREIFDTAWDLAVAWACTPSARPGPMSDDLAERLDLPEIRYGYEEFAPRRWWQIWKDKR